MPSDREADGRRGLAEPGALLGRDHELGLIDDFLDRSAPGGGVLLLVGEAGVGKTALLRAAMVRARARGVEVLHAAGSEAGGISFSGLTEAVMPLLDRADDLSATHRKAVSVALGLADGRLPRPAAISQAVLALLRSVSAERAVLVVVDDLQWLDPYSFEVLSFVVPRLTGSRIAVLAASRSPALGQLGRASLVRHEVAALDPPAAEALLRSRFPGLAPRVRQRLLDDAQGNPLALLELPPALTSRQRAYLHDLPTVLPLSERLQAVFASRIAQLPPATRDLLLLAALDGVGDLHVLRAAAGAPVFEDLAPAERERLLYVDNELHKVVFRHPLTRSAVVELSTAAQRRLAQQALAQALADWPERRAPHLAASVDQPDEGIAASLEQCAHHMAHRGDAAGAIATLTRAADLSPAPGERSRRLAEAAYLGGDMAWQLTAVRQLLDQARDAELGAAGALHVAAAAAIIMANGGHDIDAVHRLLVSAIEARAGSYEAANDGLLAAVTTLSVLCLFGGRAELWQPCLAALARLSPAPPRGLQLQVSTQADPARTARAVLDDLDSAIATLHDEADPEELLRIPCAAVYVDRLAGCRDALRRQISGEADSAAAARAAVARMNLSIDAFSSGRWDEAQQLAADSLAASSTAGAGLYAQIGKFQLALVSAARGDGDTVRTLTGELIGWAIPRGARLIHVFAWHARALAAIGQGDFEEAYQNATAISPAGIFAAYEATALWVCLDLVEAAVRTNRRSAAQAHVAAMYQHDLPAISPRLALVAHGSAGMTAENDQEAATRFDRALAVPGADRWPFDYARVQLAYGERLHHAHANQEARDHLEAAVAAFNQLGARPWVTRAARQLRATGVWKTSDGQASRRGAAALTAQELEIARLAAAG